MKFLFGDGDRLAAYAAPAAERASLWRIPAALVLFMLLMLGGGMLIGLALTQLAPGWNPAGIAGDLSTRKGTIFALATFILWWPALWIAMVVLHRRGLMSLLPSTQNAPLRLFVIGFAVAAGFGLATVAIGLTMSPIDGPVRHVGGWASWLPIALILLLIQTGAEEAVFRGYLLQQLAARFRSPWAWAVAPSLLFGALHFNPAAPGGAVAAIAVTTFGGIVLAAVTARTGGIAAAWGLHMGVNTLALLFIAPPDHLSGLALYHWAGDDASLARLAWADLAIIAALALGAAVWFSPSRRGG